MKEELSDEIVWSVKPQAKLYSLSIRRAHQRRKGHKIEQDVQLVFAISTGTIIFEARLHGEPDFC